MKRGRKRLEEGARLTRRLKTDHATIQGHLSRLQPFFDDSGRAATLLASRQEEAAGIQSVVVSLEARVDELIKIVHGIAEIEPDDKRRSRDTRREHVVRSCCHIWEDAGRAVSYTTVSRGEVGIERRGRVVDLINTVARVVTDPSTEIPPETRRHDIDRLKKYER